MTYKEAKTIEKGDTVICKITGQLLTVHNFWHYEDKKRFEIETRNKDKMYETYFHNQLILL